MSTGDIFINVGLGLMTGLAASIGFWLWTARLKHPSIKICPALDYYEQTGKSRSAVVLINQGTRPVADISIIAELVLRKVSKTGRPIDGTGVYLRIREARLPYLIGGRDEEYYLRPSDISSDNISYFKDDDLPDEIKNCFAQNDPKLGLCEFFKLAEKAGRSATVEVYVIANDVTYGSRTFPRAVFNLKDFQVGEFKSGQRCTLLGESEPNPNCCQFASSRWAFMRHPSYYRDMRRKEVKQEPSSMSNGQSRVDEQ